MKKIKHKKYHTDFEIKSYEEGHFTGYASVFNVKDHDNDIILKGAFANAISKNNNKKIPLLWQHNNNQPIGFIEDMYEDNYGLFIKAKLLLNLQLAQDAHSLIKANALNGLSIGYSIKKSNYDNQKKNRVIRDLELWEISLVTFPAHPDATIISAKNDNHNLLEKSIHRAISILTK